MTTGKRLCLNMIVRNEMANLERCLGAVVDHIACWVIGDTGSTDGTQEFINSFFAKRNIPGELHSFPFENFEQARNAALDYAYASALDYDYLLFADADMELVVEDQGFREHLEGPGYRLMQRTESGMRYWNTRLVRRNSGARYHGVTHEYLGVPEGVKELKGLWYKDHASGSNRIDKLQRDIQLLKEGLKEEPNNVRYWFYLAQSYRDAGLTGDAAETYAKRAEMGGWDEEAWLARREQARCLLKLGDEGGFLRASLAAFNQRPQRAEPLYDLARFYREKGMNDASVLFSEPGLALAPPQGDMLFVEDSVYTAGLKEEYSIAAYYSRDPKRKDRGFAACNWLALNRNVPEPSRQLAFSNLVFYLRSAHEMMPSFKSKPIGFTPPDGYFRSNPSVARRGNEILLVQRTVNYTVEEVGLKYSTPNGAPVHTRNFLLSLTADLNIQSAREIRAPANMPKPCFTRVQGFEDMRLFSWKEQLWCNACVRELTPEGWCEQVLARIDESDDASCQLADWRVLTPVGARMHEKNWMPRVKGEVLHFIYTCDPTRVIDEQARTVTTTTPLIAGKMFRGGTQAIEFDGGWLALVHEVLWHASEQRRFYYHRFVWFNENDELQCISRPFFFQRKGIEYTAGLAWHPDGERLLISYGVSDSESWISTVASNDVRLLLEDVEQLSFGAPQSELNSVCCRPRASLARVPRNETISSKRLQSMNDAAQIVPMRRESELTALALKFGTDKWGTHWYAQHYANHFDPLRQKAIKLLEIGVGGYNYPGGGESLRMWQDYFPNATIYGLDLVDKTQLSTDRIKVYQGSQDDPIILNRLHADSGGFDIIIDDGSHVSRHVIATFKILFPLLNNGGIYAVEDLQTSYWPAYGGSIDRGASKETSMAFFKSLIDGLNYAEMHRPGIPPSYFDKHITSMHFYHNLVLIYKGHNDDDSNIIKNNTAAAWVLQEGL